ncbi:MAG: GTPase Era [Proteobacteria bacterium]|nr:GTPase Era [Pseudomonadota bacterium]
MSETPHRSGYVAIAGRPNVGKSTLLNQILGTKVSIVSRRPQTTRNRVLGIYNRDDVQALFLDTPGIHEASGLLNKRMVDEAVGALKDVDLVAFMIDARRERDPERDRLVLDKLIKAGLPVVLVPNKIDEIPKEELLPLIAAWAEAHEFAAIVPISALKGEGVGDLLKEVVSRLEEGPAWFPKDQITDATERFCVGELIRESAFRYLDQELPYALAVEIEEFDESDRLVRVMARIWVERESQKPIVIGRKGSMLKRIGSTARIEAEKLLGTKVFLKITVGVDPRWTRHRNAVERLGNFGGKS